MTAHELIERLLELPGDKELRPVMFARQKMNYLGNREWITYRIEEIRIEPMAIWLEGSE